MSWIIDSSSFVSSLQAFNVNIISDSLLRKELLQKKNPLKKMTQNDWKVYEA
jgi:hypothetical protein